MDGSTSTASEEGVNLSSGGTAEYFSEMQNHCDVRQYHTEVSGVDPEQHKVQDTDVAEGTASLGRAAQPPPSEKSSTLDAKDSKRPLLDEEACGFDIPPGQCESAVSSSALLVTGALQGRRRLPRHAPVAILDKSLTSGLDHNTQPGRQRQPPPVPPRPSSLWANTSPTSDHDAPLSSPARAPPVPPKTYLKAMPQAMTTPDREAPPLPQRLYLPENKEVRGLQMSIEELGFAGVLHKPEALAPLEEEGENDDEAVQSVKPLTTVLLPKEFKHSNTAPCNLHVVYIEKNCSKCQRIKKFVANLLLERNTLCDCCKKKMKIKRRSST